MNTNELETVWAPRVLSILRIVAALIFFEHGTQKLLGFPPAESPPAVLSLSWIAGALELVGGALLILGLWTRPVAFVLSGEMAFAYWLAHAPRSFFPVLKRRCRDPLLLRVPLPGVRGPWAVEHRCHAGEEGPGDVLSRILMKGTPRFDPLRKRHQA
jgi:putative oxidoreductase